MENGNTNFENHRRIDAGAVDGYQTRSGDRGLRAAELLTFGLQFWRRRWLIAGATLAVALAAGLAAKLLMTKTWQAQALITPVSPTENAQDQMGGNLLDSISGGGGFATLFGLTAQSDNVIVALRYIAIMQSYTFTMSMVDKYHLPFTTADEAKGEKVGSWKFYKAISKRLRCEYDYKTGNMTIYFVDRDPKRAKEILSDYLDNLRNKLRNEQVQSAAQATRSLQDEIQKTSDSLLRNQLYELMARQIQRETLAQIQADFAFKVIEPPLVPDYYYAPIARNYALVSGLLTFALLCLWVLVREWWSVALTLLAAEAAREQSEQNERSPAETAVEIGASQS